MGGPGYGAPMNSPYLDPAAADNMEGYGTLDVPAAGNVAPEPYQQQYPAYLPGRGANNYVRPAPQMNEPAPDMTGYGSLNNMPDAGNVQPMQEGFNNYMSPPISYQPPMPTNFNVNPVSSGPDAMRPPAPLQPYMPYMPLQNNYAPLNAQGKPFTRSYTPIVGTNGNCMNVCRSRPMYNARPSCRPSCNSRPSSSCSFRRPLVDYAVQGQTTFCGPKPLRRPMPMALRPRPRPIYTTGGCGSSTGSTCGGSGYNGESGYNGGSNGGSGYNNGGGCASGSCGGSGYNDGSYNGGSGYNNGSNGGSGYNGGCSSGTCGGFNYPGQQQQPQQAVNLPGQLGSWADETPAVPEDAAE